MSKKWIFGPALIAALGLPVVARAHGTHVHKVMGTVSAIDGNHVTVKTTDGKTVMVMLDAKTKIMQGKTKLTPTRRH
jgi:nitrate reductase NapAB chaperone NapD